jgi:hypothetical protein
MEKAECLLDIFHAQDSSNTERKRRRRRKRRR